MKDSLKIAIILALSSIAVAVGVFFNLGASFVAFPLLILHIFIFSNFYSEAQGTQLSRLIKTIVFAIVYIAVIVILIWFLSFAIRDYFHITWWEYFFSLSGITRFFAFALSLAIATLVFYGGKLISDAITQIAFELFRQARPWLKKRILYFVALYVFIVMFFGTLYNILYVINNSSFSVSENIKPAFHDFLYFSAATMATLGASDISPASVIAKCIAVAQIFLTVFVLMVYLSYVFSNTDRSSQGGST